MNEAIPGSGEAAGSVLGRSAWPVVSSGDVGPWEDVARLVAATNRTALLDALLSLMEVRGLACPHVYLAEGRGGGFRLAAQRGLPESYLDEVEQNLAAVASGDASEGIRLLAGGLRHGVAAIRDRGELLGLAGWLVDEREPPPSIEPIAGLIGAAFVRLHQGAQQRRRSSEREAVRRAALAVGEARDLESMLQAIAERARLLTGAERVAVRESGPAGKGSWIVRGPGGVKVPRPEDWVHRIPIRHQGRQLAEIRLPAAEGSERPTHDDLRLAALFAEHVGAIVASASAKSQLIREVFEQTRLVRWLGSLVEHLPVATLLIHGKSDRLEVWVNRRGRSLLGCEKEVDIDRLLPLLLSVEGRPFAPHLHPLSRVLRGESLLRQEAQIVDPEEDVPRFVVFHGELIGECAEGLAAVVAIEDVTAFKTLERMREQWASIVTHDLRQPLTSIVGFASLLAQQEDIPPAIRNKIEIISSAARRLVRISRDLLDASLMDARHLDLDKRTTDLPALARGLARELGREADSLPIHVLADPEVPPVKVDPVRIEQVIENLLTNALKYGREGSAILVRVEGARSEVRVHVQNEGEGLEPGELTQVFQRFYRGRNARRNDKPGVGLGLFIARTLVEAHGGRIWATSIPGKEIVFSFALPV